MTVTGIAPRFTTCLSVDSNNETSPFPMDAMYKTRTTCAIALNSYDLTAISLYVTSFLNIKEKNTAVPTAHNMYVGGVGSSSTSISECVCVCLFVCLCCSICAPNGSK